MKKLLWCIGSTLVLVLAVLLFARRDPADAVLTIEESRQQNASELLVVKRDHTYEQLLQDARTGTTVLQTGTWQRTSQDSNSRLFAAQTGNKFDDSYVTFKDKLEPGGVPGQFQVENSSMQPLFGSPPSTALLQKWQTLKAKAKPYSSR